MDPKGPSASVQGLDRQGASTKGVPARIPTPWFRRFLETPLNSMFIVYGVLASPVLSVASVRTRVLLVEDNEVFRRPLHRALEAAGFDVFPAPSAEDALAVLAEMAVDLLLTDHRLPGMTGVQLVARLRTTHPALAIIVMTAYATVESAVEARRCGADDYLVKPFEVSDLLRAIDRVLDQQKLPALGRTSDTPTSTKGE